ncbi:unnamed protein product [Strongylus vulgaris]|uniref:Uncharacterized protein n=1 Tax=Strongylus vulgaris TaxID=40348 RepID=A0A3P7JA39_STRVU|nr:unnamed protein product [Strongylus vulgaris]
MAAREDSGVMRTESPDCMNGGLESFSQSDLVAATKRVKGNKETVSSKKPKVEVLTLSDDECDLSPTISHLVTSASFATQTISQQDVGIELWRQDSRGLYLLIVTRNSAGPSIWSIHVTNTPAHLVGGFPRGCIPFDAHLSSVLLINDQPIDALL